MTPWRRILAERRPVVVALAVALAANVAAYAFVVSPLRVRADGVADRALAATRALAAAKREAAAAQELVSGSALADRELTTFYDKVIPASLSAARRLTYARLPALAHDTGVTYEERQADIDTAFKSARLGHLNIHMRLQGDYTHLRRFVYELETAPEFVIIDDVTIEESHQGQPQTLTLELSTYYRAGADGT
jgi:Tfp pilus assembly protein PilO